MSKADTDDDEMLAEIKVMSEIQHEHVVRYYEMFEDESDYYVILERFGLWVSLCDG